VRENPSVTSLRVDLASSFRQLGHLYRDQRRYTEALQQYSQARNVMKKLVEDDPSTPDFQNDLAKCYFDIGGVQSRSGHADEALLSYRTACDLRERVVRTNPEHLGYRNDLGLSLNNVVAVLRQLGRNDEALAAAQRALEHHRLAYERAPQVTRNREALNTNYAALAELHRDAGHLAEAVALSLEREKLSPTDPTTQYEVARELARSAALVHKGKEAEGDKYATLAMEALARATANGYQDLNRLEKESDFTILRGREDFERLRKRLQEQNQAKPGERE
jgi:tetratricopeptide (TPR) repeat protein